MCIKLKINILFQLHNKPFDFSHFLPQNITTRQFNAKILNVNSVKNIFSMRYKAATFFIPARIRQIAFSINLHSVRAGAAMICVCQIL